MAQGAAHKSDQISVLNLTVEGEHQLLEVASIVHAQSRNMHVFPTARVCVCTHT